MKFNKAYYAPTATILRKWQYEKNPVTKAVYRDILGNRLDRLEFSRLQNKDG